MSDTDSPTVIDAAELTLLVGEPGARAYDAYPIDLADRTEAQRSLDDLRRGGEATTLVGIEFDDPEEPGNRVVVTGDSLGELQFTLSRGCKAKIGEALTHIEFLRCVVISVNNSG